ncbi:DUF4012 domain-containing protein [Candidatus Microgenomates bacterium]|jgi:hypothetical protein|nr:MAG: DUF4012 domain-containing protein [Candidatus Microgenomates bacterium]
MEEIQKIELPETPLGEKPEEKSLETKPEVNNKPANKMRKNRLKTFFIVLGVLIFVAASLGIFLFSVAKNLMAERGPIESNMANLKKAVKEQNLLEVKKSSSALSSDLKRVQGKLETYKIFGSVPIAKNYYADAQHGINAGLAGLRAADLVVDAIAPYSDILGLGGSESVSTGSGKTTMDRVTFLVTTLDKIRPELDKIGSELDTVRNEIDQINPNRYPEEINGIEVRENLSLAISTIDQLSDLVNDAKPLLEVAPDLLGVNSPKYYFVLFQNDKELRPTGGFMTAYGILKVDKGKITPILSEDIYALDANFRKRLPAPEPIKKYHKNVSYFYLRDMNLSPDFAESMGLFMDHYQNNVSGARKVDGVIAVDTHLLASLVKVLGSVGVPEWGTFSAEIDKRCDCPQIVYRLEEIADKPVSGTKVNRKAVIGPLMHSILSNAFNSPKEKVAELFNVTLTGIQEKHVLFYLFDEKSQKAVEAFNLAGRVREYEGDYQFLVDTNFGGAKSNMFIKQKIDEKIQISPEGEVTKTITVTYNNPYKASDCGLLSGGLCLNGLYRNWFRLYVPKGSELIEMTGSEIKANVYEELGKTVFEGFYGDEYPLRPESQAKVSFKYKLPFKVKKGDEYKLLIQKQPGIEKYDMVIEIIGKKEEFELRGDKEFKWQL